MKFLLYSLFSGLLMLAAVIALYAVGAGGKDAFLYSTLQHLNLPAPTRGGCS
jgi:NADH-quinone oxidoreductase subunit M